MARDYTRLRVFELADELVVEVYAATRAFPTEERFGLTAQVRRAAVSVPTNIVEGCQRPSERDYLHFLTIALGSASEVRYLLDLSHRLGMLDPDAHAQLTARYSALIRSLNALLTRLRARASAPTPAPDSPKPEARSPKPEDGS